MKALLCFSTALSLCLAVFSCNKASRTPADPDDVADAFVQAYYIDTDIDGAMQFCDGLACQTLKEELVLREGQSIAADTRRPKIRAKRIEVMESAASLRRFLYRIEVRVDGVDPFERSAYVKLRPQGETWKVTQFAEMPQRPNDTDRSE